MITKFLIAATCALTPIAGTASAETASIGSKTDAMSIVARSRSETTTRLVVGYTVDGRSLTLVGDRSSTSAQRLDVIEGSRLLMRAVVDTNGNRSITNQYGRTYSWTQLEAKPSLFDHFDRDALVVLDPTVANYLVTGQGGTSEGPAAGCLLNPWVFIACGAASGIAGFVAMCDPWISCTPSGCTGGFDCGG